MAIPSKKGLAAQFHWLKGSALVNINGGHSEDYIRNAGLLIAYRLVCFTLLIAFQVLSIKSQGGLQL